MEAYAKWDFALSIPDKDGVTEREHLQQVEQQLGMTPIALESPDFPEALEHIWSMFLELNDCRTNGFAGPNPLSYLEIKSWAELTDRPIDPFEVDGIKRLDRIFLKVTTTKK